jgi:hypothetical protein
VAGLRHDRLLDEERVQRFQCRDDAPRRGGRHPAVEVDREVEVVADGLAYEPRPLDDPRALAPNIHRGATRNASTAVIRTISPTGCDWVEI